MNTDVGNNWSSPPSYYFLDRYLKPLKKQWPEEIEEISIVSGTTGMTAYNNAQKIEFELKRTDAAFWKIMAYGFLEGGPFSDAEYDQAAFVAIINESMRNQFFNGQQAVGKSITFDNQTFRVIGVVRNVPSTLSLAFADVFVPITTEKGSKFRSDKDLMGFFTGVVLVAKGEDPERVKAYFNDAVAGVELPKKFNKIISGLFSKSGHAANLIFGKYDDYGTDHTWKLYLTTIVSFVLFMLLPAINLVNINISRILERASEIGVRKAFGASTHTLVVQFIIENIFLTFIGALIGLVLSWCALALINHSDLVQYGDFRISTTVFIYGVLISLFFGLLSGVFPAWKMSKLHPVDALNGGVK